MDAHANVIRSRFIELFGKEPLLVRSPGRINLIGEHTDYNDGFVMPAAIDKEIIFAIAPSDDKQCTLYAVDYDEHFAVDLEQPAIVDSPKWANYLLGVLFGIQRSGKNIPPFNCVFGGEIPTGAGLSSSAALECGFGFALNELFQLSISKLDIIRIAQWAEHNFAGVKCGIMDQFASVMGKEDNLILLDCRSLQYRYVPINLADCMILLCDSRVKHSLANSEYNTRREECEQGVAILRRYFPEVNSLRDATKAMLIKYKREFPPKVFDRCDYIVSELERVEEGSKDLDNGDLEAFGKKMFATHDGLSRLYEVSCVELDFLVDEAKTFDGVLGARMMGGGFGGCAITIVRKAVAERFINHITGSYRSRFSIEMCCYPVKVMNGTSVLPGNHITDNND